MQVQAVIALETMVGDSVTVVSLAAWIVPDTLITPVVSLTDKPVAYLVAVKPVPQLERPLKPADWAISDTQVRAPLAASTTSDALARLV